MFDGEPNGVHPAAEVIQRNPRDRQRARVGERGAPLRNETGARRGDQLRVGRDELLTGESVVGVEMQALGDVQKTCHVLRIETVDLERDQSMIAQDMPPAPQVIGKAACAGVRWNQSTILVDLYARETVGRPSIVISRRLDAAFVIQERTDMQAGARIFDAVFDERSQQAFGIGDITTQEEMRDVRESLLGNLQRLSAGVHSDHEHRVRVEERAPR